MSEWNVKELSPLALAFIGDAIWELHARNHVMNLGVRRPNELHKQTTRYVRADAQAKLAEVLFPSLTSEEQDILRRGRNAKSAHVRKNADVLAYRHSTGFEALIGYLYGMGQTDRLETLCTQAFDWIDSQ